MKLGVLIPEFPTQTHVFFWREVVALERLGVDVEIVSTRRPGEACPHPFAVEAAKRTYYAFPTGAAAARALAVGARRLPAALGYVASLSGGAGRRARHLAYLACAAGLADFARRTALDHVHVHSCADAAHLAALSLLLGGPSFSVHVHGDLEAYGSDHRQKMQHALFVAVAAHPMQRQVIEEAGVPETRMCTMIMGVDSERFQPRLAGARSGPLHLVTVARLHPAKGHRHALAAIRCALDDGADIRYSIVGAGPHRAIVESEVRRYGLSDRVSMLGSLSEHEVADLLQTAHAFLLPSVGIGEASPVAVMEAMASGLAVICSRIGGTANMVDDGVDGFLVDQGDERGIAAAIQRLHDDDALRNRLGVAARARAVRQFDATVRARILVETIERAKSVRG